MSETASFLRPMPGFEGSDPVPGAVEQAERTWEQAEQSAETGEHLVAAAGFLDAAIALQLGEGGAHAEAAAVARERAYDNAVTCWLAIEAHDLARRRLTEALSAAPHDAEIIQSAAVRLPVEAN